MTDKSSKCHCPPPRSYRVTLPVGHEIERDQERVAAMYAGGEAGARDEYNPYGRCGAVSQDQAECPLSDMMVM